MKMISTGAKTCVGRLLKPCLIYSNRMLSYSLNEPTAVKLAYSSIVPAQVKSKVPLVIIHGLFGSKVNWNSLAKALGKTCQREVITVDCRNHGDSPHAHNIDYPLMSLDTEVLLHDLNIKKAIVMGHSMGGKVAMTLALSRPDLVDKLIVVDVSPSTNPTSSVTFPSYIKAMQRIRFDHSLRLSQVRKLASQRLHATVADQTVRDFLVSNIRETGNAYSWRVNLQSISDNLHKITNFPACEATYQGDTLFIGGSQSNHIRDQDLPEIRRLFPEFTLVYVNEAGHWVHRDKPTEFRKIVTRYLMDR